MAVRNDEASVTVTVMALQHSGVMALARLGLLLVLTSAIAGTVTRSDAVRTAGACAA